MKGREISRAADPPGTKMSIDVNLSHRRPVLVTGAHRSGTTWVGKMLTASKQAAYISEPLNIYHRPGVMRTPTRHWYTYICPDNEQQYLPALLETLQFRYHTWAELHSIRSKKDALRMVRDWSIFTQGRLSNQLPLIKDPFAVFSAGWFAERLNCRVVITVRHPAGFASSLKRLDWPFEFHDLLEQPLLMRDWLEQYREEMQRFPEDDLIGQSALLWRMIYQVVDGYQQRFPDFQIVRHEDLSLNPLDGFRDLYNALNLAFNDKAQTEIVQSSGTQNPSELSKHAVHAYKLDSRANLDNWKRRLTTEEILRIRQITEEVARRYYPEIQWE